MDNHSSVLWWIQHLTIIPPFGAVTERRMEMHNSEIKGVMAIGAASVKSTVPGYMDIACSSMGNAVDSAEYLSKKFPLSIFSVFGPKGKCITEFLNGEELPIQSIDR